MRIDGSGATPYGERTVLAAAPQATQFIDAEASQEAVRVDETALPFTAQSTVATAINIRLLTIFDQVVTSRNLTNAVSAVQRCAVGILYAG